MALEGIPSAVVSRPLFDACLCQKAGICAGVPQPPESSLLQSQLSGEERGGGCGVVGGRALQCPSSSHGISWRSWTDLCVWGLSWSWAEGFGVRIWPGRGGYALPWPLL